MKDTFEASINQIDSTILELELDLVAIIIIIIIFLDDRHWYRNKSINFQSSRGNIQNVEEIKRRINYKKEQLTNHTIHLEWLKNGIYFR